jgi:pyridoxal phosphate enzyme (YggS family)
MAEPAEPTARDPGSQSIGEAVAAVRSRIVAACERAGRSPVEVRLVAATKSVSVDRIRAARAAGVEDFAENYAKELAAKSDLVAARWHFIGRLQRGSAARVADHADVIHSAEPGAALQRVARRVQVRGTTGRPIPVACLAQVDFTGTRQGVAPDEVESFLRWASGMPGIQLVGLMTLPPRTPDVEGARPWFGRLRELREGLLARHPELIELSMGMSGDYEVAVEEGATMVRVGTALFGPRPPRRAE